jgi:uncharacterized protein YkwD
MEAMARKLALSLAVAASLALLAASSAAAVGLGQQQAVSPSPKRLTAATPLIAPVAACPGQDDLGAPAAVQERAMRCMTDFARLRAGLPGLAKADPLNESARLKAVDILACDSFSHFACGRPFSYWIKQSGYTSVPCWRVGENLAWGEGEHGTVGSIFAAWMRSPTHRANVLGRFEELGVSLRVGPLGGRSATRIWTQHFGAHCETGA